MVFYSSKIMASSSSSSSSTVVEEERDFYFKRTTELEDLLKSSTLQVVEHEKLLIRMLKGKAGHVDLEDLDELVLKRNEEEGKSEDDDDLVGGLTGRSRSSSRTTVSSKSKSSNNNNTTNNNNNNKNEVWKPEQGLRMALQSLQSWMETFDNERDDSFLSNHNKEEPQTAPGETSRHDLQVQLALLEHDRDDWKATLELHPHPKDDERTILLLPFQDWNDKKIIETCLHGERDNTFAGTCRALKDDKHFLICPHPLLTLESTSREDAGHETTMGMMQTSSDELEEEEEDENSKRLRDEVQGSFHTTTTTIAKVTNEQGRLVKRFDTNVEEDQATNDFNVDDSQAWWNDLGDRHQHTLGSLVTNNDSQQQDESSSSVPLKREPSAPQNVGSSSSSCSSRMMLLHQQLQDENHNLRMKCESLEGAVDTVSAERSSLRRSVRDFQDDQELLLQKIQSQVEVVRRMRQRQSSEQATLNTMMMTMHPPDAGWKPAPRKGGSTVHQQMAARMDELEDEQARWVAKGTSQQYKLSLLEDELERVTAKAVSMEAQLDSLLQNEGKMVAAQKEQHEKALALFESELESSTLTVTKLKVMVEELEDLLQKSDSRCQSQQGTIIELLNTVRQHSSGTKEQEEGDSSSSTADLFSIMQDMEEKIQDL
jgi:hypothetical protein